MSMMIHRHFDGADNGNLTTLADMTPGAATGDEFDLHAPLTEDAEEAPRKRGRPRKMDGADAE